MIARAYAYVCTYMSPTGIQLNYVINVYFIYF